MKSNGEDTPDLARISSICMALEEEYGDQALVVACEQIDVASDRNRRVWEIVADRLKRGSSL